MNTDIEKLKYPIGKFTFKEIEGNAYLDLIDRLADLPNKLRLAVSNLDDARLDTPYREGGWTLRQVIHHLPDSHGNAYIRFKLAFTEENPTIRLYHEERWAECEEAKYGDIIDSLDLLDSLHRRWVSFVRTFKPQDFAKTYYHPERKRNYSLAEVLSMYVWHGEHHLAHITETRKHRAW
jgi:hypothetical protein